MILKNIAFILLCILVIMFIVCSIFNIIETIYRMRIDRKISKSADELYLSIKKDKH